MINEETVANFYEALGFEEIECEDNASALFCELNPDGGYALITDEDGTLPQTLLHPLIFACYTADDIFLWSASFKNSQIFKEVWEEEKAFNAKLQAIQKHRQSNASLF